jgi:transitional endoplasmic reticulum ATPase
VTDAVNDDNSVIALSNNTMETLQLFRGDTVLVKGKKRKDTVLIVLADDDLDDGSARINRVVRHNLRVKHGDMITVHPCPDIKYVSRASLSPLPLIHWLILSSRLRPSALLSFPSPTPLKA